MKKQLHKIMSLTSLGLLAGMLCWGILASAQDSAPGSQQTTPSAQQPGQSVPDPNQAPDQSGKMGAGAQAQSDDAGGKLITGTIMKSGDKYQLQDAATGQTYDIDHQSEVAKFEGKKVRVRGTIDPNGKMIHLQ